jgi:uncharacterized membrane protein
MITYNELMGVCAGLVLIVVAHALKQMHNALPQLEAAARSGETAATTPAAARDPLVAQMAGHAWALAVLSVPLLILGPIMSTTWPLVANTPANIAFGQPSFMLGVLAAFGAIALFRGVDLAVIDIRPITWVIAGTGLILGFISSSIWDYGFMGTPPPTEPITGQVGFWGDGWGVFVWGLVYALAGLGCVATLAYRPTSQVAWRQRLTPVAFQVIRWSWIVSGVFFLLFAAMNFRTHIGQIINVEQDAGIRW